MVLVRPATDADLPAVAAIYDEQVAHAISTFDVEPRYSEYWQERLQSTQRGDHFLVAEAEGYIVGYAYSGPYRPRPAYGATRETSVYLAPASQGRGIGRLLYDALLERLRTDEVHTVVAVVALPNDASEALHVACGFSRVGVLPEVGRKFDRWIDTAFYAVVL